VTYYKHRRENIIALQLFMHLFLFESPHNWVLCVYHLSIFNTMQQQRFTW